MLYSFIPISMGITSFLYLFAGILSFFHWIVKKRRNLYLLGLSWTLQGLFWMLGSIAQITLNQKLLSNIFVSQVLGILCLVIFIEYTSHERINTLRISIFLVISIFYIIFPIIFNSIEIIPDYGLHVIGASRLIQIITFSFYSVIYFWWGYTIWKQSPNNLKKNATILFIGCIILSFLSAVFYGLGSIFLFFNGIAFISNAIGVLIIVVSMIKEPKLMNILPFKVQSLTVIDANSGIIMFKKNWMKEKNVVNDDLLSAVIQGFSNIFDNVINIGKIEEIHLNKAILLIAQKEKYPVLFALIATKSSKALRSSLDNFANKFLKEFKEFLDNPNEVAQFSTAKRFIEEIFYFIPEYD